MDQPAEEIVSAVKSRNTALHAALAGRAWEVAELLVERGADENAVDSAGLTPLNNAASGKSERLAALLLALVVADLLRRHGGVE